MQLRQIQFLRGGGGKGVQGGEEQEPRERNENYVPLNLNCADRKTFLPPLSLW